MLSPRDWHLIEEWRRQEVPLGTVIRAIRETFERRRARGAPGKINSLSYCVSAVEELWAFERRGLVGGGSVGSASSPPALPDAGPRLAAIRSALEAVSGTPPPGVDAARFATAIGRAVTALEAVDLGGGFDAVEEDLSTIETSLLRGVRAALGEGAAGHLQLQVEALLEGSTSLSRAARSRLRKALERRELRLLTKIPAVTLFGD